jgi:hypothetical protein
MKVIDTIGSPEGRLIAQTLLSLVKGEELPAFDSEGWKDVESALRTVIGSEVGQTHFQLGCAALGIVHQALYSQIEAERTVLLLQKSARGEAGQ